MASPPGYLDTVLLLHFLDRRQIDLKPNNPQTSITLSGNKSRRESPGMRLAARVTLPVLFVQCVTTDIQCHVPQFMAKMCQMVVYTPRVSGTFTVFSYASC